MTHELTEALKHMARQLGFVLVGVTSPEPPPHGPLFERWLQEGRHGQMDYLARPENRLRRADPRLTLPECRSILVLAAPYSKPDTKSPVPARDPVEQPHISNVQRGEASGATVSPPGHRRGDPRGRVAAYAWGDDYHRVLPGRLKALVSFLEERVGHRIPNRYYTDTGPVLERDLAMRAGLGWIGKNTCLINPRRGSYLLLAEVLLGIELEHDRAFTTDHCGTCSRCIVACPTKCILSDRTLDARRCISYLTIELRGEIPPELRPLIGDWILGCDICQMVCPWNRFAAQQGDPAFSQLDDRARPILRAEVALDRAAFSDRFGGSPVTRARLDGYRRNAVVAIGNTGSEHELPTLQALLDDPDPLIREHASWAINAVMERSGGTTAAGHE